MSRAGPGQPGCFGVGWPGCHVIAKLTFVAFNKHAEIPANSNQPGACNQALRKILFYCQYLFVFLFLGYF